MRKISIVADDGQKQIDYSMPRGVQINVQEAERVRSGAPFRCST
jgi:hypothetical protein